MASFNAGSIVGELHLDRDPFTRGLREAREQAEEFERNRITATVEANTGHAEEQLQGIQDQAHEIDRTTASPRIDLLDGDARRRLLDTRQRLRELSETVAQARVDADTTAAQADLAVMEERLRRLNDTVTRPGIDVRGTQRAEAELLGIEAQLERIEGRHTATVDVRQRGGGFDLDISGRAQAMLLGIAGAAGTALKTVTILGLALAALAAAEGVLAVLAAETGVVAAMFTAAGAGVGLFGLAAVTVLKPVIQALKDTKKAQDDYNKATTDEERQKALQEAADATANLNDQQKQLVMGVMQLKGAWSAAAQAVSPEVYDVASHALAGINGLLGASLPLLKNSAGAVDLLSARFEQVAKGPGANAFLGFLARQAPFAILTLGHAVGGLGGIIGRTMQGLEPLILPAEKALNGFVDRWLDKTKDLANNPGWNRFLDFIRKTGPQVSAAFDSIGGAVASLVVSLEPLVGPALHFVTQFFDAITKLTQSSGWNAFVGDVTRTIGTLGNVVSDNAGRIGDFLHAFGSAGSDLVAALAPLVPHILGFATNIGKLIDRVVSAPGFARLVESIGTALDSIGNALASIPDSAINLVLDFLVGLVNIAGSLASVGNGIGLIAAGVGLLASRLGLLGGAGAAGGVGLLSRLARGGLIVAAGAALADAAVSQAPGTKGSTYADPNDDSAYAQGQRFLHGGANTYTLGLAGLAGDIAEKLGTALGLGGGDQKLQDKYRGPVDPTLGRPNSNLDPYTLNHPSGSGGAAASLQQQADTAYAFGGGPQGSAKQAGDRQVAAYLEAIAAGNPKASAAGQGLSVATAKGLDSGRVKSTAAGDGAVRAFLSALSQGGPEAYAKVKAGLVAQYLRALDSAKTPAEKASRNTAAAAERALKGTGGAGKAGTKTGNDYASGINGTRAKVATASRNTAAAAERGLKTVNGLPPGNKGGLDFALGLLGTTGRAVAAGVNLATGGKTGMNTVDGKTPGNKGGTEMALGLLGTLGGVVGAARSLAGGASTGTKFDGSGSGTYGGQTFANGVLSKLGAAGGAGAQLGQTAAANTAVDASSYGAALAASFAAGILSQQGGVLGAVGTIAQIARNVLKTSSPAKEGPLSHADTAPDAMGAKLGSSYAKGIRSQAAAVRSAVGALAGEALEMGKALDAHVPDSASIVSSTRTVANSHIAATRDLRTQMADLTAAVKQLPAQTGSAVGSHVGSAYDASTRQQTRDLITASRKG